MSQPMYVHIGGELLRCYNCNIAIFTEPESGIFECTGCGAIQGFKVTRLVSLTPREDENEHTTPTGEGEPNNPDSGLGEESNGGTGREEGTAYPDPSTPAAGLPGSTDRDTEAESTRRYLDFLDA